MPWMLGNGMPDGKARSANWKTWTAEQWGGALFEHFFAVTVGNRQPVSRLPVTSDLLAHVAEAASASAAQEAYLAAIRCSPAEFRRILSGAGLKSRAWLKEDPPPFLAHLLFTCFAAAFLDADTIAEGDFRERLRKLLKHPREARYPLADLPHLWEGFARWIGKRIEEGGQYRPLKLPDPGWMTRIGYSVRLAFPRVSDRRRLVTLFKGAEWGTAPTVSEAFQVIRRRVDRFSAEFRDVFTRADRAHTSAGDVPELGMLWSAVIEAASLANATTREGAVRPVYQLFLQEDELSNADPFLLASVHTLKPAAGISVTQLDEAHNDYQFLVRAVADGSTTEIVRLLLLGRLSHRLPHLSRSPVSRCVEQGVLLFLRNENGTWGLTASRPEEGTVRVLLTETLTKPFVDLLAVAGLRIRKSKFDGWFDVGPFDIASLGEPTPARSPGLATVRCLQRMHVGPQVALSDGLPVEGGFLGIRGFFPIVRYRGASDLRVFQVHTEGDGVQTTQISTLRPNPDDQDVFEFSPEQEDLEGSFNLVATHGNKVLASRGVTFWSQVLGHDYATVTEPGRWIVEAASADVLSADVGMDCFLSASADDSERPSQFAQHIAASLNVGGSTQWSIQTVSADDDQKLDRVVEAVAALSARRKGIAESDFLEVLKKKLGLDDGPGMWAVARGWLEAGYLDVLSKRHWRGRTYFARSPRLVVVTRDAEPHAILHGLAPHALRARARLVLETLGAQPVPGYTLSPFVPAPQAWKLASIGTVDSAARELDLGPVHFARDAARLVAPLENVTDAATDLLPAYERQGVWDWERGGFYKRRMEVAKTLSIEWHTRQDRPDLYIVLRPDGTRWLTRNRNWALLIGYLWSEERPFKVSGRTILIRPSGFEPYIPLPVARAINLRSHVMSGPMLGPSMEESAYGYVLANGQQRSWLLQWLYGRGDDGELRRRLGWLVAALGDRFAASETVDVPPDLRRVLQALDDVPEANLILGRRIPRRMLPHLRRTLAMSGA
jgi:hypothetical protein